MSKRAANDKDVTVNKIKLIGTGIIAFIILFILIFFIKKMDEYIKAKKQPSLSAEKLTEQLVACSDLTTAEIIYRLIKDLGAEVTLDIANCIFTAITTDTDISKVDVAVTNNKVIVTLPSVEIQDLYVDNSTLEFYDKSSSLFNPVQQEDVTTAIHYAEEDVMNHADIDGLLAKSKEQTEELIRGLLINTAGDRELIIRYSEDITDDENSEEASTENKR